jgi:hypothetical protein
MWSSLPLYFNGNSYMLLNIQTDRKNMTDVINTFLKSFITRKTENNIYSVDIFIYREALVHIYAVYNGLG